MPGIPRAPRDCMNPPEARRRSASGGACGGSRQSLQYTAHFRLEHVPGARRSETEAAPPPPPVQPQFTCGYSSGGVKPAGRPADIFGSKNAPKDNAVKDIAIVYQPKVLRSMREICEEMGVGEAVVKRWIAEGAPVAVEGQGRRRRYSAEMLMLQAWRVSSGGPPCRNIRQPCGNGPHPAGNDAGRFFRLS